MSGRDVWLTTEEGLVVRTDRIATLHLVLLGTGPPTSPIDAEIVAEIEPDGRRLLVLTTTAASAATTLGDLLVTMNQARSARGPAFIRSIEVDDATDERGRDTWRSTTGPPTGRWHVVLLGDEPTGSNEWA